jgi:hypothetical protein
MTQQNKRDVKAALFDNDAKKSKAFAAVLDGINQRTGGQKSPVVRDEKFRKEAKQAKKDQRRMAAQLNREHQLRMQQARSMAENRHLNLDQVETLVQEKHVAE